MMRRTRASEVAAEAGVGSTAAQTASRNSAAMSREFIEEDSRTRSKGPQGHERRFMFVPSPTSETAGMQLHGDYTLLSPSHSIPRMSYQSQENKTADHTRSRCILAAGQE